MTLGQRQWQRLYRLPPRSTPGHNSVDRQHLRRSGRYLPPPSPSPPGSRFGQRLRRLGELVVAQPRRAHRLQLPLLGMVLVAAGVGIVHHYESSGPQAWATAATVKAQASTPAQSSSPRANGSSASTADSEVSQPQPLNVERSPVLAQQFRSLQIPSWDMVERMLNSLFDAGQAVGEATETATQAPQSASQSAPRGQSSAAGSNRQGADLVQADLFQADFVSANLFAGNLSQANLFASKLLSANVFASLLQAANLYSTDLSEANLFEGDLSEANLYKTDLSGANLYRANLTRANLFGATLTGANLFGADLTGANVRQSNLEAALLCNTTLPDGSISNEDCP